MAVVVQDGVLGIRGTKLGDTIAIERTGVGDQYQIDFNGQRTFINGSFRALVIDGWDGSDSIKVSQDGPGALYIPCYILGGKGYDSIQGGRSDNYIFGGPDGDSLTGGYGKNILSGEAGDDYLQVPYSVDSILDGGKGNDVLHGGDFTATLIGGPGNDQLYGAKFGSTMDGGAGDDYIEGSSDTGFYIISNNITGGAGNDIIHAGSGSATVHAGPGNDAIYGSDHADAIWGEAGDDIIWGGYGDDTLSGDAGLDQIYGEGGTDTCYGGVGNDILAGGDGNDALYGDAGIDQIFGEGGNDNIEAGKGNDQCHGGPGDDQINGGLGIDVLDGDTGNNLLGADASDIVANGLQANLNGETYCYLYPAQFASGWAETHFEIGIESGSVTSKFFMTVRYLPANSQFPLVMDGQFVGSVTTDSSGSADVVFSSNPTGNEQPFPLGFPVLHEGMTFKIGTLLSGTFVHKSYM